MQDIHNKLIQTLQKSEKVQLKNNKVYLNYVNTPKIKILWRKNFLKIRLYLFLMSFLYNFID